MTHRFLKLSSSNPLAQIAMMLIGIILILWVLRMLQIKAGFGIRAHVGRLRGSFSVEGFKQHSTAYEGYENGIQGGVFEGLQKIRNSLRRIFIDWVKTGGAGKESIRKTNFPPILNRFQDFARKNDIPKYMEAVDKEIKALQTLQKDMIIMTTNRTSITGNNIVLNESNAKKEDSLYFMMEKISPGSTRMNSS
jgi:hypothetical protein